MIATHGQMSVGLKWNLQTFNETLRSAIRESSRAAPEVVNTHALYVAAGAIKLTEKANKSEIEATLGQVGTQLNYTKKGDRLMGRRKVRGQRILREDSFAARIVNRRRRDFAGSDYMLWGNALETAARKLIAARVKAVGFIKSGWIWALRDLIAVVRRARGLSVEDKLVVVTKTRKGGATPARPGSVVKAVIYNTALVAAGGRFQAKGTHNPWSVAERGLRAALRAEEANMRQHLFNKMLAAMKRAKAA